MALVWSGQAVAQQAATATTPVPEQVASASSDAADPTDIVVTAQNREERLQDVPISLAVVQGGTLQNRSIQTFEQLAPLVPNLTIAKSPAANLIFLRGIGSSPGSPSLDQSVVMFIDGIYAGNARQFSAPFLDLERLEVLRGPQGALVGRNTSAGAINIVTRRPGDTFGGYLLANYNFDFDGPTIEGAVDLPLTSAIKLRVAGKYANVDGYIRNTLTGRDDPDRREDVERVTAVVDNGGPVTLTAKYERANVRFTGQPLQPIAPERGEFLDYRKATRLPAGFGDEYDRVRTHNAVLRADFDLGGPSLTSITGYSAFRQQQLIDGDFIAGDFAYVGFFQDFEQYSQEIRLVSPAKTVIEYVVGAYASVADLRERRTLGVLFAPPASSQRRFRQEDEVLSAYGQLTWNVTEALRLNGSLRWTHNNKTGRYVQLLGPLAPTQNVGTINRDIRQELSDDRIDPAASVQFDVTGNAMLYASFSKGSKVGGFQGAVSNANPTSFAFRPEKATAYEAGAKLTFPRVGYLNLAAFRTDYDDLQVSTAIATPGALVSLFFTGNAPKARTEGVEAEFSLRPVRFFSLDGSLAWLPTAEYRDFASGPCPIGQVPNGVLPGSCNQTGLRLAFTPRWSGSLNATLIAPLGEALVLRGSASPTFQARSFRDPGLDPFTVQRRWTKLDARVAIGAADERWELALVGQNLTNKRTLAFGSTGGLANTFLSPTARLGVIDPPRQVSVQGRLRF